jgi:hypothetical protein
MPTPYDVLRDKLRDPLLALELWEIAKDQPERGDFIEQYQKAGIEFKFNFLRCVDMCAMARCKMIGSEYKASPINTIMAHFVSYIGFISSSEKAYQKKGVPQAVSFAWINQAIDSVISRITNVPVSDDVIMTHGGGGGKKERHERAERAERERPRARSGKTSKPERSERSERSERTSKRSEQTDDRESIAASDQSSASSARRRQPEVDPKRSKNKANKDKGKDDDDDDVRSKTFYMDDNEDD